MKRLLVLILLASSAVAQTQGNLPDLIDSFQDQALGGTAGQIVMPENVALNDTLVLCISGDVGFASPPYAITDTLGNTYTTTAVTNTPAPQATRFVYMAYTRSGFAGADTITVAYPGGTTRGVTVGRFSHLNGVDGSVATAIADLPDTSFATVFTTQTTTVNADVLVSCSARASYSGGWMGAYALNEYVSGNTETYPMLETMQHTGTKGSQTATQNIWSGTNFGSHTTFAMQTLAFKPDAIALTDTALPDAAASVAYSAQLHGVGGIAGYTYACTGLPANGLSLNTATGLISGATPTAGTLSLGCTVTDGTTTSATDTLALKIGTSFNSPFVRQLISGVGTFASPVSCGDVIGVFFHGQDTHGFNGWVGATSGVNNNISDTLGSVWHRVGPIAGSSAAPWIGYVGLASASGADTITVANNTGSSDLSSIMVDLANVQSVVDRGTFNNLGFASTGPTTFSDSLTTVVPNELLAVATTADIRNDTATYSPLSISLTYNTGVYDSSFLGTASVGSASTYTASATVTSTVGQNYFFDDPSMLILPFRPSLPPACAPVSFLGEKIRRQIY